MAWVYNFTSRGGISSTITSQVLITGVGLDHNKHCQLEFGEYVQVYKENNPTNSMQPRTTGAIALGSAYNLQKTYKFMSLNTGKLLHKRSFTSLPLTADAKARVEQLGHAEKRQECLYFLNKNGEEENDDNNELDPVEL